MESATSANFLQCALGHLQREIVELFTANAESLPLFSFSVRHFSALSRDFGKQMSPCFIPLPTSIFYSLIKDVCDPVSEFRCATLSVSPR